MRKVFTLAWRNFVAYKKLYIRVIVALIALLFLITLFCSFSVSLQTQQNYYLYQNISSNYTYGDKPLQVGEIAEGFKTLEVKSVLAEQLSESIFGYKNEKFYPAFQRFVIDYQNERYFYENELKDLVPYVAKESIFTQNDIKEAGKDAQFMLGRYPQNANEVVLAEDVLQSYGLTRDILGKTITLRAVTYFDNDGNELSQWVVPNEPSKWQYEELPFEMQVTVCGILTVDYTELSGRSRSFGPTMLISEDNVLAQFGLETGYVCSLDSWASKQTMDYFDSIDDIYYAGESSVKMMDLTAKMQLVTERLVLYFGSALIFGVVFTLILLCEKLCSAQMKNSGELLISGLTNKQLFCVWLVQLALAAVISVVAASLLTFGAMYGINAIISNVFWMTLSVSAATFFEIMAIGLAAVTVVTVTALGYFAVVFRRKQTRDLLDT